MIELTITEMRCNRRCMGLCETKDCVIVGFAQFRRHPSPGLGNLIWGLAGQADHDLEIKYAGRVVRLLCLIIRRRKMPGGGILPGMRLSKEIPVAR